MYDEKHVIELISGQLEDESRRQYVRAPSFKERAQEIVSTLKVHGFVIHHEDEL